jgi:hypothetical protein
VSEADEIAAIRRLLAEVERAAPRLAPNERALYLELKRKYDGPARVGFEDRRLLEVMLRNVKVRGRASPDEPID